MTDQVSVGDLVPIIEPVPRVNVCCRENRPHRSFPTCSVAHEQCRPLQTKCPPGRMASVLLTQTVIFLRDCNCRQGTGACLARDQPQCPVRAAGAMISVRRREWAFVPMPRHATFRLRRNGSGCINSAIIRGIQGRLPRSGPGRMPIQHTMSACSADFHGPGSVYFKREMKLARASWLRLT